MRSSRSVLPFLIVIEGSEVTVATQTVQSDQNDVPTTCSYLAACSYLTSTNSPAPRDQVNPIQLPKSTKVQNSLPTTYQLFSISTVSGSSPYDDDLDDFHAAMSGDMTPPTHCSFQGPMSPGVGRSHHNAPFGNDLYDNMAGEHASPLSSMSSGSSMSGATSGLGHASLMGQDPQSSGLQGSLLNSGFAGGAMPQAQNRESFLRQGHGEAAMPEGAIARVGHNEPATWGQPGGPPTVASHMVDADYIRAREMADDETSGGSSSGSSSSGYGTGWSV